MSNGSPRRRSIFSGLLFIVIGSALLLSNLWEIRFWRWLADFWPAVLILWGVAKLFDYFAARRAGEPNPRTLTGGEVFFLIVLVCVGASVSAGQRFFRANPGVLENEPFEEIWGELHTYTAELKQPVKADALISINTDRGDIQVHPEETAEIRVVVKKSARAYDEDDARKRAEEVKVIIQQTPGGYEIAPRVDSDNQKGVRVDLEVHVPKQAGVSLKTERGDVSVNGVAGPVNVTAYHGDVEVRNVGREVNAELRRGDLQVTGAGGNVRVTGRGSEIEVADVKGEASIQGEFYGPIRVRNVAKETHFLSQRTDLTISQLPGRMEVGSGALQVLDTPGSVTLITRNKDITLENIGGRIRIENRHGNVNVRLRQAPKEEVDISNESGSVELAIPADSTFELAASSRQGEVESDFQGPDLKATGDDRAGSLQGKVGARGPRLQLKTTYGPIRLRKID